MSFKFYIKYSIEFNLIVSNKVFPIIGYAFKSGLSLENYIVFFYYRSIISNL